MNLVNWLHGNKTKVIYIRDRFLILWLGLAESIESMGLVCVPRLEVLGLAASGHMFS